MSLFGKKENEEGAAAAPVQESPAFKPQKRDYSAETSQDTTYFGKNLKITGNISGEGSSVIQGAFEGDVNLRGQLKVAKGASIKGNIKASDIYINGKVDGVIEGSQQVHLENTAQVTGKIITPQISILVGAIFNGEVVMNSVSVQQLGAASLDKTNVAAKSATPKPQSEVKSAGAQPAAAKS